VLRSGDVALRPLSMRDADAWRRVRGRNLEWLTPWEATVPPGDGSGPASFRSMVRGLRRQARQGRAMPFAVTLDDEFVGQLTVSQIVGGSARWAQIGYWIDRSKAGRGVIPVAVAMAVDHCLFELGLHRVEIAIRPENTASLRVVEKLGFVEYGYAKGYLHIDGAWRDHRLFAISAEDVPGGLLRRYRTQGPRPRADDPGTGAD
jgi:ribosomal-protein-alanine N-acetyltransferase